jgi:uncharacterized protein DUF4058
MPLHDWTDRGGWEGVHHFWLTELARWVKPRLPAGYRAFIGSPPALAVNAPPERPDVSVRGWPEEPAQEPVTLGAGSEDFAPDLEVAVATLEQSPAVHVERQGRLIAAIEVISPRNKDRPAARASYLTRYLSYLLEGVHLLLVDVHRRPLAFSFADGIATELGFSQLSVPAPLAISYRVGEVAATGGKLLAIRGGQLTPGVPLPSLPLALDVSFSIKVDLEATYARAAADAYLT